MFGMGPTELLIVAVFGGMCSIGAAAVVAVIVFVVIHGKEKPSKTESRRSGMETGSDQIQPR